jgi:hypothetical protein
VNVKLVITKNGQRISNLVHEGVTREEATQKAEVERSSVLQKLQESKLPADGLEIKDLLLG